MRAGSRRTRCSSCSARAGSPPRPGATQAAAAPMRQNPRTGGAPARRLRPPRARNRWVSLAVVLSALQSAAPCGLAFPALHRDTGAPAKFLSTELWLGLKHPAVLAIHPAICVLLVQDGASGAEAAEATPEEDETTRAFRQAAVALREQREEAAMSVEERISKCAET